ncbi:TetR/AcrR family transcriptional regulator [Baekduia soli]|uniref:TetR/AcrR family transcriptional regulator n=1 Tax=Baekduia soli TaxID=496014 RepID=A0A5B8U9M3_9ACTN|nr:TetR/AcrR family transcriptional regulator [Baekduia soli]QEC49725.1 TetR/AcrR family transcriptional regulator [Baekduia soli]
MASDTEQPLRPDIAAAATRVFSELGYHGASMQDVADAVGIRKASLYHHVRKKEDLLFAIHDGLIDELIADTLAIVSSSQSPSDKLRDILRSTMRFVARNREGVTVFLHERAAVSGERWDAIVAKRNFYESMVRGIIADGVSSGRFIDVSPEIAARGLLAMANWGYTWFRSDGPLSADEVADIFATIALRGLEPR